MIFVSVLVLSGCKSLSLHHESLRDNKLSATACQARSSLSQGKARDSKPGDDPWMSDEAQEVCRHLQ